MGEGYERKNKGEGTRDKGDGPSQTYSFLICNLFALLFGMKETQIWLIQSDTSYDDQRIWTEI